VSHSHIPIINKSITIVNYPANGNELKWTEMDSFCSCQMQILILWIHFYPIKVFEFFKSIWREKTKWYLFFSIKKKCRPL